MPLFFTKKLNHNPNPSMRTFTNIPTNSLAAHYSFSAKERDTETGLSYFGARYYSSDLSIWLSVDPMSGKYPHQSNYVYCSNNPIKVIDPNGEDEWEIDEKGNLKWLKSKEVDILHSTKTRQSMEFPVGTIKEMTPAQGVGKHPEDGDFSFDYNYMDIDNDELADCFFEFVAENTVVEWGHIKYSENGNRIAITTNMPYAADDTNPAATAITYDFIRNGIKVRESNHSHPFVEGKEPKPSGPDYYAKYFAENCIKNFCEKHKCSVPTTKVYGKVDGNWSYTEF